MYKILPSTKLLLLFIIIL